MLYSFAQSGAIPLHRHFSRVSNRTHTPLRALWLFAACCVVLGLPLLRSLVAFNAVVSLANVFLLLSYAIPIACRLTLGRREFAPGPYHLGRYSAPVGWTSVVWALLASVRTKSLCDLKP